MRILMLCLSCVAMNARPLISQPRTQPPVGSCVPTATETRINVVGAMVGSRPVWLVDGSNGHWDKRLVKTLLVLSRDVAGSLRIEGRRLDGPGLVAFQDGLEGAPTNDLVILSPWQRTVKPGGASAEVMRSYAFVPMYVIYPSAGCWELTARLDATEVRIVLELM